MKIRYSKNKYPDESTPLITREKDFDCKCSLIQKIASGIILCSDIAISSYFIFGKHPLEKKICNFIFTNFFALSFFSCVFPPPEDEEK